MGLEPPTTGTTTMPQQTSSRSPRMTEPCQPTPDHPGDARSVEVR